MIDTSRFLTDTYSKECQHTPKLLSFPSLTKIKEVELAQLINHSHFRDTYTPITEPKKYKAEYIQKIDQGLNSDEPDEIAQAVCGNRKIDSISKPHFDESKFVYFAEGRRDHLPYQITCDYSQSKVDPAIKCEVLPFAE